MAGMCTTQGRGGGGVGGGGVAFLPSLYPLPP